MFTRVFPFFWYNIIYTIAVNIQLLQTIKGNFTTGLEATTNLEEKRLEKKMKRKLEYYQA